ncbi:MAG: hypothetical protein ACC657_10640 [Thiohalomonadales bacterium]
MNQNILVILVITAVTLSSISCTEEIKNTTGNKPSNYDLDKINNIHESTTLLVLYKDKTTSKSIDELEKKLPQYSRKSLNSSLMFSYQFSTVENSTKVKSILENATIVNEISNDWLRKINQVYGIN